MENTLVISLLSFLILIFAIKFILRVKTRYKNLPPSPLALPILGHLHLLSEPFHRTLHTISQKHGPIFSLRLGSHFVVVVSSLPAFEECFTKNDVVFANRPRSTMGKYVGYDHTILGLSPYGDHWRNLRRILNSELLSTSTLNATSEIRKEEIKNFLKKLYCASRIGFEKVEMKTMFAELTLHILMRIVTSKPCSVEQVRKIMDLNNEFFSLAGSSYPGDYFPILKLVDFDGYIKKAKRLRREFDSFFQNLIDQQRNQSLREDNVMVDLLSLQKTQPEYYTDELIRGLSQDMLVAGTFTTSVTLEWAMSNLINHPKVLEKAKAELEAKVGPNRMVNEADMSNLPYLRNIILESQRLYPAAPLLVSHFSSDHCTVGGYNVPSGTTLVVNAWAIQRDPKLWDDPTSFKPDRHDEQGKGSEQQASSKVITFGMGRRGCPGTNLAMRVLGVTLASMIQCFEWEKVDQKDVDMAEGAGLTMPKAVPLEAMCKARPIASKLFSQV